MDAATSAGQLNPEQAATIADILDTLTKTEITPTGDDLSTKVPAEQILRQGAGSLGPKDLNYLGDVVLSLIDPTPAPPANALVEIPDTANTAGTGSTGGIGGTGGRAQRPTIVVTVAYDVLTQRLGMGTLDNGAHLHPETVRRLACDAHILPAVLGMQRHPTRRRPYETTCRRRATPRRRATGSRLRLPRLRSPTGMDAGTPHRAPDRRRTDIPGQAHASLVGGRLTAAGTARESLLNDQTSFKVLSVFQLLWTGSRCGAGQGWPARSRWRGVGSSAVCSAVARS
nr:DUF222 domain-containing protein [Virgisporangium aliadipatigenens]